MCSDKWGLQYDMHNNYVARSSQSLAPLCMVTRPATMHGLSCSSLTSDVGACKRPHRRFSPCYILCHLARFLSQHSLLFLQTFIFCTTHHLSYSRARYATHIKTPSPTASSPLFGYQTVHTSWANQCITATTLIKQGMFRYATPKRPYTAFESLSECPVEQRRAEISHSRPLNRIGDYDLKFTLSEIVCYLPLERRFMSLGDFGNRAFWRDFDLFTLVHRGLFGL